LSLNGVKLKRINDSDDVAEYFRWLGQSRSVLAFDTETKGLNWAEPGFTRLVQFGDTETGYTIATHLWGGVIEETLRKYEGPMVAWNLKFDQHALDAGGFPIVPRHRAEDAYLMHALLYPLEWHGLKPVSEKLLGKGASVPGKRLDSLMKQNKWTWATIPYECLGYSVYGALDTVLCARLYELLKPQIDARFPAAYEREMMTSHIMFEVERRGLSVDLDYTERLHARYAEEMSDLLTKIQFFGVQNPNSRPQIEHALRSNNWEPTVFTENGAPSLKKEVLKGIDHELAQLILEYRWREKYSSYTEKILRTHDNGILYPSINTFEARTGRMSIGSDKKERGTDEIVSVPWQQIPHTYDVRRCVLPRYEDWALRPADYDSQELRVEASLSNCTSLIEAINTGQDMHIFGAERMFGGTVTKGDPKRDLAKMTAYLIIYGGGPDTLAEKANVSVSEAQRIIDLYKATFPEIAQYNKQVINTGRSRAQREGRCYIETWGGRECETDPDFAYKLTNYVVQGSCADLLKEKLIALDSAGFTGYIDLPVHDELLMSVPNDEEGDEIAREIASIMEEHKAFKVPLTVELSDPVQSWGHKYLKNGQLGWDELQTAESVA
jgi:DNA polymerase-1